MLYSLYNRVVRTYVQKENVRTRTMYVQSGPIIFLIREYVGHIVQAQGCTKTLLAQVAAQHTLPFSPD
jgi:hypothetical protein